MKLLCISLGCDKNLVDTEMTPGLPDEDGYTFTDDEQEADVIVTNTCCLINGAREESVNTVLEMTELKKMGQCKALIVTGCPTQRYRQEIIDEISEVDGILGTSTYNEISNMLKEALGDQHISRSHDLDALPEVDVERVITTGGYYAFLKTVEGCDEHCTYCIIPSLRGNYRSVPIERVLKEAESLAKKGVKELILVIQETTLYGADLYGEKTFPKLLRELCKISGIQWIRIQHCYPEEITDELIRTIKEEEKICNYLDILIRYTSDKILRRMGRRTNQAWLKEMIAELRREIPDLVLRTTLISGLSGGTDEDHETLMVSADEMEFEWFGVFAYSVEEDTPVAEFEDQVPEELKEERHDEIMEPQQEIALEHSDDMVGRVLDVLIEGKMANELAHVSRTCMDAPNVDGFISINTDTEPMSGDFVRVEVTGALEYDLIGEMCE